MNTKNKIIIMSLFLILTITSITFLPSLNNGFTNWDDDRHIVNNPMIYDISGYNIKRMFTTTYCDLYQPLLFLSFAVEYKFFKLKEFVYHLNNLLLHLANSILVFFLILMISRKIPVSLIVALLFGIHPLHVESVAWATERKDVLYSLFFLSSIICYLYYRKKQIASSLNPRNDIFYYLSLFLFILSLFTKSMAVTLPFVLILCDYLTTPNEFSRRSRRSNEDLSELSRRGNYKHIPFFIISIIFTLITIFGVAKSHALRQAPVMPVFHYIFTASYGFVFYLFKTILPTKLSCFYAYPQNIDKILPFSFLISPFVIIILFTLVILSIKKTKKILFGTLFFLITILPVIQLIPTSKTITADRYTYIPLIGLFYIIAEGINWVSTYNRKPKTLNPKPIIWIVFCITLIMLSFLTWNRCKVWKDSITLWSDVLNNYPNTAVAYNNLGSAVSHKGEYDKAFFYYNQALKFDPKYAEAYYNRANKYSIDKEYDKAIADYTMAIKINPYDADAYYRRGNVYYSIGENNKSADDFNQALKINPYYSEIYYKKGNELSLKGDYDNAIYNYNKILEFNPKHPEAYYNRGIAYNTKGEYDKAITDFTEAIKIKPNFAEAYNNRGIAHNSKGDFEKAISDFSETIKNKQDYVEAYNNRGVAYNCIGKFDEALSDFNKVLKMNPDQLQKYNAYNNRGITYGSKGKLDKAISDFTHALRITPNDAEIYNNRGIAYFKKGEYEKALEDVKKSQSLGFKVDSQFLEYLLKHSKNK